MALSQRISESIWVRIRWIMLSIVLCSWNITPAKSSKTWFLFTSSWDLSLEGSIKKVRGFKIWHYFRKYTWNIFACTVKLGNKDGLMRNKLVLRNHFPWPICYLLHKDKIKEHLALRNNFRATEKFLKIQFLNDKID